MKKPNQIKYSNCWEDADLLLYKLQLPEDALVLSIASGGDNSFSLLTKNPAKVILADMNLSQLHLCELKMAAFKRLHYNAMISFLGFKKSDDRINTYQKLKDLLSIQAQQFWDGNLVLIEKGVIHCGKFENYFRLFRNRVLPLIHNKSKVHELLRAKSSEEQKYYYNKTWNSWRWRLLFRVFFSKWVMGTFGRTKSYLNQVEIPVANYIFQAAERHLSHVLCQQNHFLHYIFTENFVPQLPHYAREEHFDSIKNQLHKIELFHGSVDTYFSDPESVAFCNFSNIFEYMSLEQFKGFKHAMVPCLKPKAQVAFWNLMVDRKFSAHFDEFKKLDLDHPDLGFFYMAFNRESI